MPPVRDLAREYGAATVTIHRALKMLVGDGWVISHPRHGFRVRLGAADPERGLPVAYVNSAEHGVGGGRDEFHRTLLAEFQRVAGERGWPLLVVNAERSAPAAAVAQIAAANACGAITNGPSELLGHLQATGIPTVVVDAWDLTFEADCILQDGFKGGMQAARHLLQQGHTQIAWVGPALDSGNAQILERWGGSAAALKSAGLAFATESVIPLGNPAGARQAARSLLVRKRRPNAILALWQDATSAVVEAAEELGLTPGKDFQLVGWCTEEERANGFFALLPGRPVFPVVTWKIAHMAEAAVARLKQRRAEPHLAPEFIRVPTRLSCEDPGRAKGIGS